ncbi:MAG TPA: hypothetical protein DCM40_20085, partial [Maribacter sp.]|nr:hypothetical protein [Maribacter sp.]
ELKAFPYFYANLIVGFVNACQDIVNKSPTELELNAIRQGDPAEDFGGYQGRENPAYHAMTERNHVGLAGVKSDPTKYSKQTQYGILPTITKGDPFLMPANSVQYYNARVSGEDAISASREEKSPGSLKLQYNAAINQLKLAMAASPENTSKFLVIKKAVDLMAVFVFGEPGSEEAIAPNALCIRNKDNQSQEQLDHANDAFGDALGSGGLLGFFKDRARNAQVAAAQATLDQRSGQGEVFAESVAEKILFREQCFLLSFVNTISKYKKTRLDYVNTDGRPADGVLGKRLPYAPTGYPLRNGYQNASGDQFDIPFNACLQVQGDAYGFINRLTQNKNTSTLHDIESWHLSGIQPRIRLFKVIYDEEGNEKEVELKFNSHFSADELDYFKNARSRGAGVGLKSFTFTYDGSNPFAAKKSIKANMKI